MKKIIIPLSLIILIVIGVKYSLKNTIEDALNLSPNMKYEIINSEEINNRVVVLSKIDDGLHFAIIKKGLFKYTNLYSGYSADYQRVLDVFEIIIIELPREYMKNKLYGIGIVRDASISRLEFSDHQHTIETQVINNNNFMYWSTDLSKINERQIVITAYSDENEIFNVEQILYEN